MRSKYPNLDEELRKRDMNYRQLGPILGLSDMAMYRRMVGGTKWSLQEAMQVRRFFNGVDINHLFETKERR